MYTSITNETKEWLKRNMMINSIFYRAKESISNIYIVMFFENRYSIQFMTTNKCDSFKYDLEQHEKDFDIKNLERELIENCECERIDFQNKYIKDFILKGNTFKIFFKDDSELSCELYQRNGIQGCRFNFCGVCVNKELKNINEEGADIEKLRKSLPKNVFKAIKKLQKIIKALPPKECYSNDSNDYVEPNTLTCTEEYLMSFLIIERDNLLEKCNKTKNQNIEFKDFAKEMHEYIKNSVNQTAEEKNLRRIEQLKEYNKQAEEGYIRRFYFKDDKK